MNRDMNVDIKADPKPATSDEAPTTTPTMWFAAGVAGLATLAAVWYLFFSGSMLPSPVSEPIGGEPIPADWLLDIRQPAPARSEIGGSIGGVGRAGAVIRGKVVWGQDDLPSFAAGQAIDMRSDSWCDGCYDAPPQQERITIEGAPTSPPLRGVADVIVWISKNAPPADDLTPIQPAVLHAIACRYWPPVVAVVAGQPLMVRNHDQTVHDAHGYPNANSKFNLALMREHQATHRFPSPEMNLNIESDVHPWMAATVHVMSHPWFAVTNEAGEFEIRGLPAGTYTLSARHPLALVQTTVEQITVTVETDGSAEVNLALMAKRSPE